MVLKLSEKSVNDSGQSRCESGHQAHYSVITDILNIYVLYGFDSKSYPLRKTVAYHLRLSKGLDWIKYWKYCLASFFSYWKEQPQPPCIIPAGNLPAGVEPSNFMVTQLLLGRAKRFTWSFLKRKRTPSRFAGVDVDEFSSSFLQSILLSKKGMLRPGKDAIDKTLSETYKMLTEPNKVSHEVLDQPVKELFSDFQWNISIGGHITDCITEVVNSCFQDFAPSKELTFQAVAGDLLSVPSSNANYTSSRDAAGTLGDLMYTFRLLGRLRIQGKLENPAALRVLSLLREFFGCSWSKLSVEQYIANRIVVRPFWSDNEERREEEGLPVVVSFEDSFIEKLRILNEEVSYLLTTIGMTDRPTVKLVGLAEALKVRVISKGPGYVYYRLKPFQKAYHRILRSHPVFRFIGEPVSDKAIGESFGRAKDGDWFISGDYKDATNNLNPVFSDYTLRELLRCSDVKEGSDLSKLFYTSMTRHYIQDPDSPRDKPVSAMQRNGQLMGAILSFPVLCIVNAATLLASYRILHNRRIPFSHLKNCLRINGDDFVALTKKRDLYEIWRKVCYYTGMEESPGKTFVSQSFLNMNSREFSVKYVYGEPHFSGVPFINMGLMKGAQRSTGLVSVVGDAADRGLHDEGSLPSRAEALLEQAPRYLRSAVYDQFLNRNRVVLNSVRLPWFVPQMYGGVGLPCLFESGRIFSLKSFPLYRFDIDGNRSLFELNMHKFGQIRTYPTVRDFTAMHATLVNGGSIVNRIRPLCDPMVYTMFKACRRFLPTHMIPYNPGIHGNMSSNTPLLQNVILLAEWFLQTESIESSDGELSSNFLIDDQLAVDIIGSRRDGKLKIIKNNERLWGDAQKLASTLRLRPFEDFDVRQFGPSFVTNNDL